MRSFDANGLLAIFPRALRVSPDYWNLAQVIAPELAALFAAAERCAIYCRVDTLPEEILDALAADLDVFWWKPNATSAEKRLGIKQALAGHRQLGTVQAVKDAVNTYLGGGTVEEWFEYGGEPHHFRITGADVEDIMADYPSFLRVLGGVKRASAVMEDFGHIYLTDEYDVQLLFDDNKPLTT